MRGLLDKKLPRLSISAINMYFRCPLQYEFRYIKGIKIPPVGVMVQGRVYHQTHAGNFSQKVTSMRDLSLSDMADMYATKWENEVEKNSEYSIDEIMWEGEQPYKMKDEGFSLVKEYHLLISPEIVPLEVEQEKEMRISDELRLHGILDLIAKIDSKGISSRIIDHKLSKRSENQNDVDRDLQASMYLLLNPSSSILEFHRMVKKKRPEVQILKTSRTEEQLARFVEMAKNVQLLINTGIFYPKCDSFWCSKNYCGYWDICKEKLNI